jgi:hypothetical protein
MGTYTTNNSSTSEDMIWGPGTSNGGASLQNLSMPLGWGMVWGTTTFSAPPFETAQGFGTINANWQIDWMFSAASDDDCEPCNRHDKPAKESETSPRSQILGEVVDLVGTPFFLHYESSRVPGHAGADLFALKDALNLAGWTLSVHHVFEPVSLSYGAGGGARHTRSFRSRFSSAAATNVRMPGSSISESSVRALSRAITSTSGGIGKSRASSSVKRQELPPRLAVPGPRAYSTRI